MNDRLADEFHQAMLDIHDRARKHEYHATYFLRMIQQHGGVGTAKRLLQASSAQYGLSRLWELGLLHISMEAHVLQKRWAPLFTDAERRKARDRLLEYGYVPSYVNVNGINLYYEEHGFGFPLVWSHEFAGDYRSWNHQVNFFSRRYRVITYNARGYPPSDVPESLDDYTQAQSVDDLKGLLDHLGIEQAHVGGLSMGGNVALNFGLTYPEMARSLIVAGTGSGSTDPEAFRRNVNARADQMRAGGMAAMGDYSNSPTRVQLMRKDPLGYEEFRKGLMEHSALGSALTFSGVQGRRPTIFALEERMKALDVPTLIMTGDEDGPCIETSIFMKRCIPKSGLAVIPQSGHAINLEEPDLFNRLVLDFLTAVEQDAWAAQGAGNQSGNLV